MEDLDDNQINLLGVNEDETMFLTQKEHEIFLIAQTEMDSQESEEYKQ